MNKNIEYYRTIVDSMIKKSFPILKRKKIIIFEFNSKTYYGGALKIPFIHFVFINKRLRKKKKELMGVLAHELSHLETFDKKGWLKYSLQGILYWINSGMREKEDKEADMLAIKKGYGRELYSLKKLKRKKKLNKYYLSAYEVKKYAMKIKKW